ncbi:MAG: ImmA/IrrE family metallo-endopeptidase, partial [Nitrosospira sp.]|nr:ImmA/IrrE family metallo-endopeptidase [Nitrosospira sp.]
EAQLMRFFHTSTVDSIPYMSHAARKTRYEVREIPPVQLAWLFRVHQIASELTVPRYSENSLRERIDDLHSLMTDPAEIRQVPKILEECGVRLVVVESLPNSKIDGVCFWIDNQPVIGMSLRFDRIDNFWFVLRHEIEHVLKKHGRTDEIIDDLEGANSGQGEDLPKEERIANLAAAEFCTPRDQLDSFYQRKHPYISERDIVGFARRLQVHPGVVIGQIHRKTGNYRLLRRYLVNIREYVTPYVVSDGWGDVFPVEL